MHVDRIGIIQRTEPIESIRGKPDLARVDVLVGERRDRDKQHGAIFGRGTVEVVGRHDAARTGLALDDHGGASRQIGAKARGDETGETVDRTTDGIANQDGDGLP